MKIETIDINKIQKYANNPRNNDKSIKKVVKSLKLFGWKQPIVVDKNMEIIAGHTRYEAAKQLHMTEIPVVIAKDLTPAKVKAYRLADNRSAQDSTWNMDALKIEFEELEKLDFDLSLTGFEDFEINDLTATDDVEEDLTEEDAEAFNTLSDHDVVSQAGDIWILGKHRVMCGDSTSSSDVEKLMNGEKANMVFTDPPYNVAYDGCKLKREKIKNDEMSNEKFIAFLSNAFNNIYDNVLKDASLYVCFASSKYINFYNSIIASGFNVRALLIWSKNHFTLNWSRYKCKYEPIFYCHVNNESDNWYGDNSQTNVWEFDKPAASKLHPTMKPIELIIKAINNSSKKGDLILDLFLGSGSTLIASEKSGRRCVGIELEPFYVDVIIKRWQKLTQQKAVLESTGQSYPELKNSPPEAA